MKRSDCGWRGHLWWPLGGLLIAGAVARGESPPPLADQLLDLGRQAVAQGAIAQAETFYRKALKLDPDNAGARRALDELPRVRRVSLVTPDRGGAVADWHPEQAQATLD